MKDGLQGHAQDMIMGSADTDSSFAGLYHLGERIGRGGFADVHQAFDRSTGEDCAVKIVTLPGGSRGRAITRLVRREVEVLRTLRRHPGILCLKAAFQEGQKVYIVTDRCVGGDLLDELLEGRKLAENEIRDIMWSLVGALEHMQANGVCHRDLKLENILISSRKDRTKVKLADFGLAAFVNGKGGGLSSMTGSALYVAPEVLRCRELKPASDRSFYDERADIWSVGVCLYTLLSGQAPFNEPDREMQFSRIMGGAAKFPAVEFLGVSAEAIDLIRRMLVVDPSDRITVEEIKGHPWMVAGVCGGKPGSLHNPLAPSTPNTARAAGAAGRAPWGSARGSSGRPAHSAETMPPLPGSALVCSEGSDASASVLTSPAGDMTRAGSVSDFAGMGAPGAGISSPGVPVPKPLGHVSSSPPSTSGGTDHFGKLCTRAHAAGASAAAMQQQQELAQAIEEGEGRPEAARASAPAVQHQGEQLA